MQVFRHAVPAVRLYVERPYPLFRDCDIRVRILDAASGSVLAEGERVYGKGVSANCGGEMMLTLPRGTDLRRPVVFELWTEGKKRAASQPVVLVDIPTEKLTESVGDYLKKLGMIGLGITALVAVAKVAEVFD